MYYGFDLGPQFWTVLIAQAQASRVQSVDRVKAELDRGKDDLASWASTEFAQWFASTGEPDVFQAYGQVMVWAQGKPFTDAAKAEFARADNADAWVVAYAMAKGKIVTTLEQLDPAIRRRIAIPNVCQDLHVPCVDTFQMLRNLGLRLG